MNRRACPVSGKKPHSPSTATMHIYAAPSPFLTSHMHRQGAEKSSKRVASCSRNRRSERPERRPRSTRSNTDDINLRLINIYGYYYRLIAVLVIRGIYRNNTHPRP